MLIVSLIFMFLCGWVLLSNLGNWDQDSFKQVCIALVVFLGACAVATCGALS